MLHLDGHDGPVYALAFAPDGQALFSAGNDGTVRAWDVGSATERLVFRDHGGPVRCLAAHVNGRVLASGADDGIPRLWDLKHGTLYKKLEQQRLPVTGLAWLPQAKRNVLMAATYSPGRPQLGGNLVAIPLDNMAAPGLNQTGGEGYMTFAVTAEGPTIAWANARHVSVRVVTHQTAKTFRQPVDCHFVVISPDGKVIASTAQREVYLWSVAKNSELAIISSHKGLVDCLAFSPDGRTLATACRDGVVRFCTAGADPAERVSFNWDIGGLHTVTFSPDGLLAATAGDSGRIVVWDMDE